MIAQLASFRHANMSYAEHASPADSTCSVASRERDFSWSSIYVTPRKPLPPTPHTRHHQHAQLADLDARGAQRAARRWCHAQFLAAASTGVFFALGPAALLAACRSSWRAFALALLCWSAGGALPPPTSTACLLYTSPSPRD